MERAHFEQARLWLEASEHVACGQSDQRYAVATAMAIHAIIKANDALTVKFLGITARRHDDARRLFEELVKKGFVRQEHASHRQTIQDAIDLKARVEYRLSSVSKRDYEELHRKAVKFVAMVSL